jgi:hypothetical protein
MIWRRNGWPQIMFEPCVVRQHTFVEIIRDRNLRIGKENCELGRSESLTGCIALRQCCIGRDELDVPVKNAPLDELVDESAVDRKHQVGADPRHAEKDVLLVVVTQDVSCDLVSHAGEEFVALLVVEVAVPHGLVEKDLDVHLMVGRVNSGGIVDGIGINHHARTGCFDATQLGKAKVAAFADDPGAQLATVDPNRIIGLVTNLRIGL